MVVIWKLFSCRATSVSYWYLSFWKCENKFHLKVPWLVQKNKAWIRINCLFLTMQISSSLKRWEWGGVVGRIYYLLLLFWVLYCICISSSVSVHWFSSSLMWWPELSFESGICKKKEFGRCARKLISCTWLERQT